MVGVLCPKAGAIVLLVLLLCTLGQSARDEGSENPHIFVVILARNQEHTLRNFLGYLERLDYPKHRMSVWWVKIIKVSRAVVYRRAVDKRIRDKRRYSVSTLKKQTQTKSLSIIGMLYCVSGSQPVVHLQEEATFVHLCKRGRVPDLWVC